MERWILAWSKREQKNLIVKVDAKDFEWLSALVIPKPRKPKQIGGRHALGCWRVKYSTMNGKIESVIRDRHSRARTMQHDLLGIEGLPRGTVVDHINRNPLDNRRENLRVTTQQVNTLNANRQPGESGIIGVSRNKKRWSATVCHNYKTIHLGTFDTPKEAAKARRLYIKEESQ